MALVINADLVLFTLVAMYTVVVVDESSVGW